MAGSLFRKKSIDKIVNEYNADQSSGKSLNRILTVKDLVFLGMAAVIGAGIFSTIGSAAYDGGPGISILFVITAVTCGFAALCYAEFASRVPISGSAYTYAYVSFGELIAWIIGWALILEYAIGNIVVAISWSGYFNNLLEGVSELMRNQGFENFDITLPGWLTVDPTTARFAYGQAVTALNEGRPLTKPLQYAYDAYNNAPVIGGSKIFVNLPAFLIVVLITAITYVGIKESKKAANAMVVFKVAVIIFVILLGAFSVKPHNWSPFMPNGLEGVLKGVSSVFYAYIGFDALSTTAEECRNPRRDLPKGMIYSLLVCTGLYILIALVLTGMVDYRLLNVDDPLAEVFNLVGKEWVAYIISFSAVIATTSVLLVFQLGQPRIWMSMSRDGLLPKAFSKIHPKYNTPYFSTIITGILVAVPALVMERDVMTDLTSIGTLVAFVIVSAGVLFLPPRVLTNEKGFTLPYFNGRWVVPVLAILFFWIFSSRIATAIDYKLLGKQVADQPTLGGNYVPSEVEIEQLNNAVTLPALEITSIEEGSLLDDLGFEVGDKIFRLNDSLIQNTQRLEELVKAVPKEADMTINFVRGNKEQAANLYKGTTEIFFLIFTFIILPFVTLVTFIRKFSLIPVLGVLFCSYLLIEIPAQSWIWFMIWLAIGLAIYFLYGYRKSKLAVEQEG